MRCVQFSDTCFRETSAPWLSLYYDLLYSSFQREGWIRPKHFWEPPLWAAHVKQYVPDAQLTILTDEDEIPPEDGEYAMSVTSRNLPLVRRLLERTPERLYHLGGYIDPFASGIFDFTNTALWWNSMATFVSHWVRQNYQPLPDHSIYATECAERCIPRLTLSTGCLHRCTFCDMPRTLTLVPVSTVRQDFERILTQLRPTLIYLNDKTFGQAENWRLLYDLYPEGKKLYSGFKGFIIQTTAAALATLPLYHLAEKGGVRYAEIGVETYNDEILRVYRKPASERLIDRGARILKDVGILMIPNLMLGLNEETYETYERTRRWVESVGPEVHHFNITHVVDYAHSATPEDLNENHPARSWHTNPELHHTYSERITMSAIRHLLNRRDQLCTG